jgi:hypothetical protein
MVPYVEIPADQLEEGDTVVLTLDQTTPRLTEIVGSINRDDPGHVRAYFVKNDEGIRWCHWFTVDQLVKVER